jgi:protein-S-isoprenylcysteine O-methyltransferase Ste14
MKSQLSAHAYPRAWTLQRLVARISDPQSPPLGLALMALGLGLKFWAMRTLGQFYARTLRTATDQPIVDAGPYQHVRHSGYLGAVAAVDRFRLTTRNWIACSVLPWPWRFSSLPRALWAMPAVRRARRQR